MGSSGGPRGTFLLANLAGSTCGVRTNDELQEIQDAQHGTGSMSTKTRRSTETSKMQKETTKASLGSLSRFFLFLFKFIHSILR